MRDTTTPGMFIFDLDGTLVTRQQPQFTDMFLSEAERAVSAGWRLVFATSRNPVSMMRLAVPTHLRADAVVCNSAVLMNPSTGVLTPRALLNRKQINEVVKAITAISPDTEIVVSASQTGAPRHAYEIEKIAPVPDIQFAVKIALGTTGHADTFTDQLRDALSFNAFVTSPGSRWVEVTAPGTGKAVGVAELAAQYGIPAERCISFGDSLNDVDVAEWAGTAVAVGDAHPRLLQIADARVDGPELDGVPRYMQDLLNR